MVDEALALGSKSCLRRTPVISALSLLRRLLRTHRGSEDAAGTRRGDEVFWRGDQWGPEIDFAARVWRVKPAILVVLVVVW